jgi:6-phosphogluconolactonase
MQVSVFATDDEVAHRAAALIADEARAAIAARGSFHFAVSGGHTPWVMLRDLSKIDLPWPKVHLYQVDERVAPEDHEDRNLTHLRASFTAPANVYAMPVNEGDLDAAAWSYAALFRNMSLDLVHLGMGPDGHTASLVPGDPVLNVTDVDVAMTGVYQNRRRMTTTYPLINRSRRILWLVTGASKAGMTPRLLAGDPTIPAGRVKQDDAVLLADRSARGVS